MPIQLDAAIFDQMTSSKMTNISIAKSGVFPNLMLFTTQESLLIEIRSSKTNEG